MWLVTKTTWHKCGSEARTREIQSALIGFIGESSTAERIGEVKLKNKEALFVVYNVVGVIESLKTWHCVAAVSSRQPRNANYCFSPTRFSMNA